MGGNDIRMASTLPPVLSPNNVPRNFQKQAKQSFEMNISRQVNMVDTLDSFFDKNKLYIKSVQQEATQRGNREVSVDDPLLGSLDF